MRRIVVQEENGQLLSDDEIVALAITTLNNATTAREYLLQLADIRRTLERGALRSRMEVAAVVESDVDMKLNT